MDTSFLLRRGNKISMEGVAKDKMWNRDCRNDHLQAAPPGDPSHIQSPNPDTFVDANKCLLTKKPLIVVSREAPPVPDKYRGGCSQLTIGLSTGSPMKELEKVPTELKGFAAS